MTGFGAAEGPVAGGRLRVEVRTVNHRYFNFAPKLPGDLSALEGEIRERLRLVLERGHVAVTARWLEAPVRESEVALDLGRAEAAVARLRELQAALGLGGEVSLELVARQPDVLVTRTADASEVSFAEVEPIVAQAADACRAMRGREGAGLARELEGRLARLESLAQSVSEQAPHHAVRERDRLRESVRQLLDGRPMDEQRLAQEVALLADRLDITEELVRFRTHVAACRSALGGSAPVGKQLGFLAQELGREVNTMGSKASDALIQQQVIAMKGELEKLREQVENLE
jgi:uncharacterized protein (TIGR00255 family)